MTNVKTTPKWLQNTILFTLAFVFTIIIFLIDINLPKTIVFGAVYSVIILYSWLLPGKFTSVYVGIVCTILVIIGLVVSPIKVEEDMDRLWGINFIICLIVLWVCVALVSAAKTGYKGIEKANSSLEAKIAERTKELIRSQNALQVSEKLYRYLYEHANEMHASVDPHSAKIIKCNETLCEKLGYTKDELVGSEIFMAYDSTCHLDVQRAFDKFQRTGQVKNVELVLKTKQGKKIDVILNVSSVKNEDGEILYSRSSWTDITKLKRVEKERITYARRLEAQNKELEQFVFIASHDLQEPLRTVTSFTDLLANDYKDSFDETGQKSLKFIVEATGRMRILVKGLLDYSRIGKDSEIQAINISILISEIEQDLGAKIASTGAKIKTGKLPREVMSYGTDLRQLFQNLIVNAIKFRKEGVHPVVEISHIDKKNMHQFSIADNGIGIAKEHHGKVFKIFKRLNNRTNYDGTGIGLAHCQKIVDLHGGKIWVESVFGEGSTFYFTVPKHKKG